MKKVRAFLSIGISIVILWGISKNCTQFTHAIAIEPINAFSPPLGANITADESWKIAFAGHKWLVIGYNGTGVAAGPNVITVLLSNDDKDKPKNVFFAQNNFSNEYDASDLQRAINTMLPNPQSKEFSLIVPRLLDGTIGNAVLAHYWPLSFAEITSQNEMPTTISPIDDRLHASILYYESISEGFPPSNGYWLLRSPALLESASKVWAIASDGMSYTEASAQDAGDTSWSKGSYIPFGVRPAIHLDMARIFAILPAENENLPSPGTLEEITSPSPKQGIKFTAIDSYAPNTNPDGLRAELLPNSVSMDSISRTLYFGYKNASIGENIYISCLLREKNAAKTLYYGNLARCANANSRDGNISLPIPQELADGEYTLQVFCEKINEDFRSNFASQPFEISLAQDDGLLSATAPQNPETNSANSDATSAGSANNMANKQPTSPATGDRSHRALSFILMMLSLAIFRRICYSKKTSRA